MIIRTIEELQKEKLQAEIDLLKIKAKVLKRKLKATTADPLKNTHSKQA